MGLKSCDSNKVNKNCHKTLPLSGAVNFSDGTTTPELEQFRNKTLGNTKSKSETQG